MSNQTKSKQFVLVSFYMMYAYVCVLSDCSTSQNTKCCKKCAKLPSTYAPGSKALDS